MEAIVRKYLSAESSTPVGYTGCAARAGGAVALGPQPPAHRQTTHKRVTGTPDLPDMDFSNLGKDPSSDNRRKFGRVVLQDIGCSLGQVLDLSASGMRVESATKPVVQVGQTFGMVLQSMAGPVNVVALVTWIRKTGWRKHQLGLHFVNPTSELRRAICELARGVASNEVVRPDIERFKNAS